MIVKSCESCSLHKGRKTIVQSSRIHINKTGLRILFLVDNPTPSNEVFGRLGIGPEIQFLTSLLFSTGHEELVKDYHYVSMVKCLPGALDYNPTICYYTPENVLKCSKWVYQEINQINPDVFIFIGGEVTEFYTKEFSEAITIPHIRIILKQGGTGSPMYLTVLRTLKEGIEYAKKNETSLKII